MRGSLSKPLRSNSDGMLDTDASRAYDALGAPVGLDGGHGWRLFVGCSWWLLEGDAIFGHHGSSPSLKRTTGIFSGGAFGIGHSGHHIPSGKLT